MFGRPFARKPQLPLQAGLVFLVLASLARHFLPRFAAVPADWADGGVGLLYGLAIGLMLLGLWRARHSGASCG